MAKGKKWIVTTSGNRSLKDIKKELAEAGFGVDQVLEDIGVITGTADDADRLRSIPGVADVSPDHEVHIAPPDAPIQ